MEKSKLKKKLPIGIDDFKKLRKEDFYYVDKTGFIGELLNDWGKVNLFHSSPSLWKDFEHEHAKELL